MSKKILVLGSSNIDLILKISRFHQPGETIIGENLVTAFGGKGANQAIAARRLGGNVALITKLGDDHYGKSYRHYLIQNGLPLKCLLKDKKLPTGVALIELNPKGENRIIVSPGLEMAKEHGALTLLNPSPSIRLSSDILSAVDFLVPNELEAQFLTGLKMKCERDIPKIAKRLLDHGVKNVVITLGSKGLFFKNQIEKIWMKAFSVNVVDTTAAGDAFMGALACGLAENRPIRDILKFANGAGALATTKLGAQPSLPFKKELEKFLLKMI